jgi:hypothetical protein
MCLPMLSPALAIAKGKINPLTAISPALGLYKTLTKNKSSNPGHLTEAGYGG